MNERELLPHLLNPEARTALPAGSRAHVRVDISIRAYWHTLFDICPGLLDIADPDGMELFLPFMQWAQSERLSMNWTFYLWVARWLAQSRWQLGN